MYEVAERIIDAVCAVGDITWVELLTAPKSLKLNVLRGLCCYFAWDMGVHARIMGKMIRRSRSNIINMGKKYRHYLASKDKITIEYYNRIKEYLYEKP